MDLNLVEHGPSVPVIPATPSRLQWRAVASWMQAAGASLGGIIIALAQNKETVAPLIPVKYAWIGAVIFAAGKIVEAVQHQKDLTRPTEKVNMSAPASSPVSEFPEDGPPTP